MEPLYQCIYPDCQKISAASIEKFCLSCGRLCRCYHGDCQAVLDVTAMHDCPNCHRALKVSLSQRSLDEFDANQGTISNSAHEESHNSSHTLTATDAYANPNLVDPNHAPRSHVR